jgi:hypothetical protein
VSEPPITLAELVPVSGSPRSLVRTERSVPVVLLPALAATSFAAGAAAVGLARRRRIGGALAAGRRPRRSRGRGGGERLQIVGTRSVLLDVHLIGRPGR